MTDVTAEPGTEWIVDAHGCDPERLRSRELLEALMDGIITDLALRPVAPALWHQFPGPGGLTGVVVLSESHLTCHTFPERGYAAFNLYCCRPRAEWPWKTELASRLGATDVSVTTHARGVVEAPPHVQLFRASRGR
jgi:S-adenosylmethionine decarboxylase